jgi:hypothetical protein
MRLDWQYPPCDPEAANSVPGTISQSGQQRLGIPQTQSGQPGEPLFRRKPQQRGSCGRPKRNRFRQELATEPQRGVIAGSLVIRPFDARGVEIRIGMTDGRYYLLSQL